MSQDDLANRTIPIRRLPEGDSTEETVIVPKRRESEKKSFATLRIVSGRDAFRVCAVYEGERVVVGRDLTSDLVLTDSSVSRRHLAVTCRDDGVYVDDLGSSNGTRYRGRSVTKPTLVKIGTDVQVGRVQIRLERLGLDELSGLARLRARLHETDRDPLCGVLSRQYIEEVLPEQLRGYTEAQIVVSGCFLNVDGFKKLNESQGHLAGDRVLRKIAALLEDGMRESDDVVRFGGDEFLLVLAHCGEEAAFQFADRLRRIIEKHDWSRVAEGPCTPFRVTVSVGVAEYRGEGMSDWLARAARALSDAKAAGRNMTRRASPAEG